MFEDLNSEELKRRANSPLSGRVVATVEARGRRRSVTAGETLYKVDDVSTRSCTRFPPRWLCAISTAWCWASSSLANSPGSWVIRSAFT